ncbi:MAG: 3'-5' exonuclease [Ignavibacteria bacterium]|jgi:superfamily I DNA and RNA helicase
MPVIPSSISSTTFASNGEKKLHGIFSKLYSDSDDEYVWYEPPSITIEGNRDNNQKRFTDFIVFGQTLGILNLEVKDWKKDKIRKIDNQFWEIETDKGENVKKESPFEQSRRCAYAIKNKLLNEGNLKHQSGTFINKLLFPFAFGVVFSNLSRKDLNELGVLPNLFDSRQILCKEDLSFEITDKEQRFSFEKKLKDMFTTWFDFEPLDFSQIKTLRAAIWPELIVTPVRTYSQNNQLQDLKLLDLEQENFAKSLGDGHYLIKGVAGSGKTLVLAYRARYLLHLHPNWNILFVCYNKSLKNYVEKMINNIFDAQNNTINISHFHKLVKIKSGNSVAPITNESSEQWDERVGIILRQATSSNRVIGGKYDAILLDEAQDFSTEWLRGIRDLLNQSDSLTIALDPAQDVYGRKRIWKDAKIDIVGGRRSRKLKQSYRNTSEILKLAIQFQGFETYIEEDDGNPENILVPEEIERHGEKPNISKLNSPSDIIEQIQLDINNLIATGRYSYKDIGIIVCSKQIFDTSANSPSILNGIPTKSLLFSNERNIFNIDEDTVKIITVESSKGLEWKVVFLIGVDDMPRSGRELKHERNLIYIGITRAQEQINIYFNKENDFTKSLIEINNKL